MAEPNVRHWTRETKWRQGHVLLPATAEALQLSYRESPGDTCVVVVSHDCDIAQDDLAVEPCVEVIVGHRVQTADDNYTATKSPRRLHLKMQEGGATVTVELEAATKISVHKSNLREWAPDPRYSLTAPEILILKQWLGIRYTRAAFPNEFERRLKDVTHLTTKIEKALRPVKGPVAGIYFQVEPLTELPPDDQTLYELVIQLLYQDGRHPLETADKVDSAAEKIQDAFREACFDEATQTWRHIKLLDCVARSEQAATIAEMKRLQRWRLDHWSYKAGAEAAMPPDLD